MIAVAYRLPVLSMAIPCPLNGNGPTYWAGLVDVEKAISCVAVEVALTGAESL